VRIPRTASRAIRIAIALVAVTLLGVSIGRQWGSVTAALHRLGWGWFLLSFAAVLVGLLFSNFAWRTVMADLGSPLPIGPGLRVFFMAQIGKYLPGAVWPFVAQMELGRTLGVPRRRSALGGLVFVGLHCATGLLIASALLPFADRDVAGRYWWLLALTPVLLVVLHPKVLSPLLDRGFRLLKREPLERPLTLGNTVRACGFLVVTWVFYGLSLLALAGPLGLTGPGSFFLATGGYALAWCAGVLVLGIVPAGIGIREIVLAAVLVPVLGKAEATTVVAASRIVQTLGDALWALAAAVLLRGVSRRAVAAAAAAGDPDADPDGPVPAAGPGAVPAAGPGAVPAGGRGPEAATGATRAAATGVDRPGATAPGAVSGRPPA
jgi:glycosyltransferase 2 family protein